MTMFGHRNGFGEFLTHTGVPGGYRNPPGRLMGLLGPIGEEEGRPRGSRVPLPPKSELDKEGGGAPLSFPLSLLLSPLLLPHGKGGSYSWWE